MLGKAQKQDAKENVKKSKGNFLDILTLFCFCGMCNEKENAKITKKRKAKGFFYKGKAKNIEK